MYVYQAIRRTKENPVIEGTRIVREVLYEDIQTEAEILDKLEARICGIPGIWRIYRSVNRRNPVLAKLELIETLTKQLVTPEAVSNKNPESLWKDILMQPKNKASRLFLVDIDTKDYTVCNAVINSVGAEVVVHKVVSTPNGYHVVCDPFNPERISNIANVSIKKDALLFISLLEIE